MRVNAAMSLNPSELETNSFLVCRESLAFFIRAYSPWRAFKEEWDRHLQDTSRFLQPTGTNPIGALLVFLYLLEGDAQSIGQFALAHV